MSALKRKARFGLPLIAALVILGALFPAVTSAHTDEGQYILDHHASSDGFYFWLTERGADQCPARTIASDGIRAWERKMDRNWTRGYWSTVAEIKAHCWAWWIDMTDRPTTISLDGGGWD